MINMFLMFAFLQMSVQAMNLNHVTVYRPPDVDVSIAKEYLTTLQNMYDTYSTRLESGREGRLKVRLCGSQYSFAELTGKDSIFSPLWHEGMLYIIARDDIDGSSYRTKLETGVIQGVLNEMHENGAPEWLVYSVAVYESGEYKGLTPPPFGNVKYFSDLDEKMQSVSSETGLSDLLFYLGNTGKFLDMKFGVGSMMRLIHDFDHMTSFDQAVESAYHISPSTLEDDWRRYLAGFINY